MIKFGKVKYAIGKMMVKMIGKMKYIVIHIMYKESYDLRIAFKIFRNLYV